MYVCMFYFNFWNCVLRVSYETDMLCYVMKVTGRPKYVRGNFCLSVGRDVCCEPCRRVQPYV